MSLTLIFQEASGAFVTTSGRILTVPILGYSPTVFSTFLYSTLTFFPLNGNSVATGSISGATSGYYAYQWGNPAGWSLESPWIKGTGIPSNSCLVYGTSYNLDGTPAVGITITAFYNEVKGIMVGTTLLGAKKITAIVASDGSWSLELLQGAHVKFTDSINPKIYTEGIVPSTNTASVDSFSVNI